MGRRRSTTTVLVKRINDVPTSALPVSLRKLVIGHSAKSSPIRSAIKHIPGGQRAVFELLRLARHDDEDAARLVTAYDDKRRSAAGPLLLEEVLDAVEMAPRDFIGLIAKISYDYNIALGDTIAAFSYPKIMKASVEAAQTEKGIEDRKMHLQHTGYLPTSKGIQIGINNRNVSTIEEEVSSPGRPASFDRTARTVVRELKP